MSTRQEITRQALDQAYAQQLSPQARANLAAAIERLVAGATSRGTDLGASEFDLLVRSINPGNELTRRLKALRETAGLTQAQVAHATEWSQTKVVRMESGRVKIDLTDLRYLLDFVYRVHDQQYRAYLIELARKQRG